MKKYIFGILLASMAALAGAQSLRDLGVGGVGAVEGGGHGTTGRNNNAAGTKNIFDNGGGGLFDAPDKGNAENKYGSATSGNSDKDEELGEKVGNAGYGLKTPSGAPSSSGILQR